MAFAIFPMDTRTYLAVFVACVIGNAVIPFLPSIRFGLPLGFDQWVLSAAAAVIVFMVVDRLVL